MILIVCQVNNTYQIFSSRTPDGDLVRERARQWGLHTNNNFCPESDGGREVVEEFDMRRRSGGDSCDGVPDDVKEAFAAFSDDGIRMHVDGLRRFLIDRQGSTGEDALGEADWVFQIFRSKKPEFLLEDFQQYLFDTELNPPIKSQVVAILKI